MTNEEAISRLKYDRDMCFFDPATGENDRPINADCAEMAEALEVAIKALETVERFKERRRELEIKMHNSFSLSEATEHYALVKLLREADKEEGELPEEEGDRQKTEWECEA